MHDRGDNGGAARTATNLHARHVRRYLSREGNFHEQERQGSDPKAAGAGATEQRGTANRRFTRSSTS